MYIHFHFGSDGVSSIVERVAQNKRLSIKGHGEREREKMSCRVAWEVLRCSSESGRERKRKERWNERKSETGIAREQLRTRATYDSTLADYAHRGVERFDKTRLSRQERGFMVSLINPTHREIRNKIRIYGCLSKDKWVLIILPPYKMAGSWAKFHPEQRFNEKDVTWISKCLK